MPHGKYISVERLDRPILLERLASSDSRVAAEALYSATYYDPDWRWVQTWCLEFLKAQDVALRWAAAPCLGDRARVHNCLDLEVVLAALLEATTDPTIADPARFSLSMVKQFVKGS